MDYLCNTKVCYTVHNSSPIDFILTDSFSIIFTRFILILSSHQLLRIPSGIFLSGVPTKTSYVFLISRQCHHYFYGLDIILSFFKTFLCYFSPSVTVLSYVLCQYLRA
jgi:hypothetical protein